MIKEADEFAYLHKVVLVAQGQSGQDYRMCTDYRPINRRTQEDPWPTPDVASCLRRVKAAKWFSAIDLKAGYHNIPIEVGT